MSTMLKRISLLILPMLIVTIAGSAFACDPTQKQQADHAYQIAAEFIKAKKWQEAIPQLESALGICPDHTNSLKWLGKAYYQIDDYDTALEYFLSLLEVAGSNASTNDYMDTGRTYAKLKQYKQAVLMYKRAAKLAPQNCGVRFNLGVMEYAAKDYAGAVETLEGMIDDCPDLADKVNEKLAKACEKAADKAQKKGDVSSAAAFREKYAMYSRSAGGSTAYKLISQLMRNSDYAGAAQECETFLGTGDDTTYREKVLLNLARCRTQLQQHAQAADAYRQYLELKPDDTAAAEKLAELLPLLEE